MTEITKRKILPDDELSFAPINDSVYAIVTSGGMLCGITFDQIFGIFINDSVQYTFYGVEYRFNVVGIKICHENKAELALSAPGKGYYITMDAQYLNYLTEIPKKAYRN